MNPGRFFIPRVGNGIFPMMSSNYIPMRGNVGIFSKITSSLKSFNWKGLLSGANNTLNVVNQTIPLVRQAGPMFNNMKSMLKLAKVFGNETHSNGVNNNTNNAKNIDTLNNLNSKNIIKNEVDFDTSNYPNFFV